jgi:hypothetical protein
VTDNNTALLASINRRLGWVLALLLLSALIGISAGIYTTIEAEQDTPAKKKSAPKPDASPYDECLADPDTTVQQCQDEYPELAP